MQKNHIMKQVLCLWLVLYCTESKAQKVVKLPYAIEDARMDTYLRNRPPATLTIKINNAPDSIKEINVECTFVSFGANFQQKKYYTANKNGFLKIILGQNLPYQQIWLKVGDYLYAGVYVNTGLVVTIDARKIQKDGVMFAGKGVEYSGADGTLNRVMNERVLYKRQECSQLLNALMSLPAHQFSEAVSLYKTDSIEKCLNQIDDEFISQFPGYAWAIRNETASDIYQWINVHYMGKIMPAALFARVNQHKPFFTSNAGVQFYRTLSMYAISKKNNPSKDFDETILNKRYETYDTERKALIDSINDYLAKPVKGTNDSLFLMHLYKKRRNLFPEETEVFYTAYDCKLIDSIYDEPKSDILKLFLLERGKNSFEQSYPLVLNDTKTLWCRRLVSKELEEATAKQKNINALLASSSAINDTAYFIGSPLKKLPFGASLYQLDSIKNTDTFIKNLQLKFRNKALIIDFWATWCAPCLSDLPYSKKLHEANKDLPVEYVYICTNSASNVGLWEKTIAGIRLPGTHIFMDEKIVEALKSSFNNAGSGFPSYVVIDTHGNFRPKVIERMQFVNRDNLKQISGSDENQ